ATSTTLEPSVRSVPEGQPVTLTARVAPSVATGRVIFSDGTTVVGRGDLTNGAATLTTFLSGAGDHVLRASYAGDPGHAPSVSAPQTIAVSAFETTQTTLGGPDTGVLQSPVTLTATVTPTTAQGTVVFIDKTTTTSLGTSPVVAGTATLTTTVLGTGRHEIMAVFTDVDGRFGASASAPWLVTIVAPTEPPPPEPDPGPDPVPDPPAPPAPPAPPVSPLPDPPITSPVPPAPPVVGQAPGAPRRVVARATDHRKVVVTWRAPASAGTSAVTSYVVVAYRGTKQVKQITVAAGRTKATVTKLTAGVRYRFVVRARNASGAGPASAPTKTVRLQR
ncbi:MAG TPA: Ig-like domain repeat protein, partial [Microlunatus sp.]|nr:Ig-like domain repeat protein [Microlunatus sp.]